MGTARSRAFAHPTLAACARGIGKVQLMVRPQNGKVQAFYQALGYGEQKRVLYAKWLDGRALTP